jgi:predicted RNA-binding protein with PUA-like domain
MAYWLFKSEPDSWSWDQQKKAGTKGTEWTGVRNFQARNNMKAMKLGDKGFFYHSNEGKEIVGIVEVAKLAHPDSTTKEGNWECVDIRAVTDVPKPVTLDYIKTDKRLKDMVLVNNSRLSVQPVSAEEWKMICDLGGVKKA